MKAIVLHEPGGPEQLRLEDVPTPEPGPGQVTVALRAAALNRRDIAMRAQPRTASIMPYIPGSDGAGVVAATGAGVSQVKVGDEVVVFPSLHWGMFETHPG